MGYIGPSPNPGQNREVDDISSGFNGSEVNFTLQVSSQNVSPGSSNAIIVSLGGVVQNPGTDYTVAASTLTFTTAPASGLAFFGLVLGQQVDTSDANFSNPVITGDLSIEDKIVHTGDTNTAIRFPASDTITAETGGSERVRIMSDGRVGVGTSPDSGIQLHVQKSGEANMILEGDVNGQGGFFMMKNNSDNANTTMSIQNLDAGGQGTSDITFQNVNNANNEGLMRFSTRPSGGSMTERMRIDSAGNVGINESNPSYELVVKANDANQSEIQILAGGNGKEANIVFGAPDDADVGKISYDHNGDNLKFVVNTAERMRINSSGHVSVGTANSSPGSGDGNTDVGAAINSTGRFICNSAGSFSSFGRNDTGTVISFTRQGGDQGNIGVAVGSVSFNTSSDYRLKENITSISDGITRLKTLKPLRFNFIEDTTNTLRDGFLAHEVTAVPEAITGTKDEVDSDNKPVYQAIDQSKLVPLLTAALQEAVAKIETLETKVAALEAA